MGGDEMSPDCRSSHGVSLESSLLVFTVLLLFRVLLFESSLIESYSPISAPPS